MASRTNLASAPAAPHDASLWIVLLGPPTLWLVQFQLRYALVPWCCASGHREVLWAVSGVSLCLAFAMAIWAFACWRRTHVEDAGDAVTSTRRRSRFMALLGVMSAVLFGLVIIAQALPVWFVDPCYN